MSAASRARTLALLGSLGSASCTSWRVQQVSPEALLSAPSPPSRVRLRLQDSSRVDLRQAHLEADSVTGTVKGVTRTVPLSGISEVAVKRFSAGRTVGLVAGGFAGLYTVALIGCEMSGGCGPDFQGFTLGP
jgi:hypothetical protein